MILLHKNCFRLMMFEDQNQRKPHWLFHNQSIIVISKNHPDLTAGQKRVIPSQISQMLRSYQGGHLWFWWKFYIEIHTCIMNTSKCFALTSNYFLFFHFLIIQSCSWAIVACKIRFVQHSQHFSGTTIETVLDCVLVRCLPENVPPYGRSIVSDLGSLAE